MDPQADGNVALSAVQPEPFTVVYQVAVVGTDPAVKAWTHLAASLLDDLLTDDRVAEISARVRTSLSARDLETLEEALSFDADMLRAGASDPRRRGFAHGFTHGYALARGLSDVAARTQIQQRIDELTTRRTMMRRFVTTRLGLSWAWVSEELTRRAIVGPDALIEYVPTSENAATFRFSVDPNLETLRAASARFKDECKQFLTVVKTAYGDKQRRGDQRQFQKGGKHLEDYATWFYLTRVAVGENRASIAALGREYHVVQRHPQDHASKDCEEKDRKVVEYGVRTADLRLSHAPRSREMIKTDPVPGKSYGVNLRVLIFRPEV